VKLVFKKSFAKDLRQIQDKAVFERVRAVIKEIEGAGDIQEITSLKKLSGGRAHYRLRLGDYRLGLVIAGDTVTFVRILHRKDIYRYFP